MWEPDLGGWTDKHKHLIDYLATKAVDLPVYLGGFFPKQRISAKTKLPDHIMLNRPFGKPLWSNFGFWDYSWVMTLPSYKSALFRLIVESRHKDIGIMCSEVLPWNCHRSMIADALWFFGYDTMHMQPRPKLHSEMISDRLDRYEEEILDKWKHWKSHLPYYWKKYRSWKQIK